MSVKKIIPLIIILGVILSVPAQVEACPTYRNKMNITIDRVDVSDYDGDGFKEDAFLQGGVTLYSSRLQTNVKCKIAYYLVYLPDGTYTGEYTYGTSWVLQKTYWGFTSSPMGEVNDYSYNIDSLPYPGWYSVKAVVKLNGETAVSNTFIFDPPGGGGPGPIGR